MRPKVSIYVCSKPLQYFNVRNLPKNSVHKNILAVEDKFKDAGSFYERVKRNDNSWDDVLYIKDRSEIFFLCLFKYKALNVYYYLDFMLRAAMLLYFLPCKNVFVYEEGISAYRTDMFEKTTKYRRKIRRLIGLSEYAGLHPRTKGIYVYDEEKYLNTFSSCNEGNLKPLSFNVSFKKMIEDNLELALKIFEFDPDKIFADVISKRVLFYITSWPLNENVFNGSDIGYYNYCVIKPHPHIRELDFPQQWKNNKTIFIESVILAEFLIKILIDRNNIIDIYHHNSSAVLYLEKHPNIRSIIDLNRKQILYSL